MFSSSSVAAAVVAVEQQQCSVAAVGVVEAPFSGPSDVGALPDAPSLLRPERFFRTTAMQSAIQKRQPKEISAPIGDRKIRKHPLEFHWPEKLLAP